MRTEAIIYLKMRVPCPDSFCTPALYEDIEEAFRGLTILGQARFGGGVPEDFMGRILGDTHMIREALEYGRDNG